MKEEYNPVKFFKNLSGDNLTTVQNARKTASEAIMSLRAEYDAKIKTDPSSTETLRAELDTKILAVKQTEVDTIRPFVESGNESDFESFATAYLSITRPEMMQPRKNFREDQYASGTIIKVNNIQEKLTKPLAAMTETKKNALLKAIITRIDAMIPQLQAAGTDTELLVAFKAKLQDVLGITDIAK